jgi:hypothetical protein
LDQGRLSYPNIPGNHNIFFHSASTPDLEIINLIAFGFGGILKHGEILTFLQVKRTRPPSIEEGRINRKNDRLLLDLNAGAHWANIRTGTIIFAFASINYIHAVYFCECSICAFWFASTTLDAVTVDSVSHI